MKTLVLGLGNPILRDDGVGLCVAREVEATIDRPDVTVSETELSGLRLLDILTGYDRAIIVDAIETRDFMPGQVLRLTPDALDGAKHLSSVHDVNFATALDLGRKLGLSLPGEIVLYAIVVSDTGTFDENCTEEVQRAVPVCVEMVLNELGPQAD
jgi:hydrogenase maturation protease